MCCVRTCAHCASHTYNVREECIMRTMRHSPSTRTHTHTRILITHVYADQVATPMTTLVQGTYPTGASTAFVSQTPDVTFTFNVTVSGRIAVSACLCVREEAAGTKNISHSQLCRPTTHCTSPLLRL